MATTITDIMQEAWDTFAKWCREHDPDGDHSCLEQAEAYARWCDGVRGPAVWQAADHQ